MQATIDAPTLRRAMSIFAEALRRHRDELNSLNVYPVPDGDTGTNMLLTQEAVEAALEGMGDGDLPALAETIAHASLLGARGNSGVILSQVLRGLCETVASASPAGPRAVVAALRHASEEADRAVAHPVEGTILSVLRDAATAAERAASHGHSRDPEGADIIEAALAEARASLQRTRQQLPELRRAGVVDAGGKGLVLLLDGLLAAVRGGEPSEPVGPLGPVGTGTIGEAPGNLEFIFEVQYLLEAPDDAIATVRSALDRLGDSLVIVGGAGLFNVHVHTNEPETVVKVGSRAGRATSVSVVDLRDRIERCIGGEARAVRVAEQLSALVVVAEGDGLRKTFGSLGALVVPGGPGNNPSVGDLTEAIEAAPADSVLVLPNHRNVIPSAELAAGHSLKTVHVVPSRSIPHGIAAATAFNPMADIEANADSMREAVDRAQAGELSRAERDAETPAGPVTRGDWLALAEGTPVAAGRSLEDSAVAIVRALSGEGSEIVTLVVGADASHKETERVREALRRAFPDLVSESIRGGQPRFPFLIGVE